ALARIVALYTGSLATSELFPFQFSEVASYATSALTEIAPRPGSLPYVAGTLEPLERAIGLYASTARTWEDGLAKTWWLSSARGTKAAGFVVGASAASASRPEPNREGASFGRCNLLSGPSEPTGSASEPFPALQNAVRRHDRAAVQAAADK